jgi:predicted 3-demethylubiquinone-9 3-methyltransferase (glyoxalase superfamily)
MCGWLKDKFGLSWQIVPSILGKLVSDPEKGQRVIQVFSQMKKFNIQTLINA